MGKIIQLSKKFLNLYWLNHSDLVWAIFDSERNVGRSSREDDRNYSVKSIANCERDEPRRCGLLSYRFTWIYKTKVHLCFQEAISYAQSPCQVHCTTRETTGVQCKTRMETAVWFLGLRGSNICLPTWKCQGRNYPKALRNENIWAASEMGRFEILFGILFIIVIRGDWLWKTANINDKNNSAAVYVGSTVKVHNPLFSVGKLLRNKLMQRFYWSIQSKW